MKFNCLTGEGELERLLDNVSYGYPRSQVVLLPDGVNPRTLPNGTSVKLKNVALINNGYYSALIQKDNIWGFHVIMDDDDGLTRTVNAYVRLSVGSTGYVNCVLIGTEAVDSDIVIKPRYMANKALGGAECGLQAPVGTGKGVNTLGTYVRTTGKVLSASEGSGYISDGSVESLRVWRTPGIAEGDYVALEGIVISTKVDDVFIPVLCCTDVEILKHAE